MTFMVFMYAAGGYAVVVLAGMLFLEHARGPVTPQRRYSHAADRPPLRPWSRIARSCAVGHERTLPLRTAQRTTPARRKRPAATSCRR